MTDEIDEVLNRKLGYSRMMFIASRIWYGVLTKVERESVSNDLEKARSLPQGVIGLLAEHRKIPLPRAIVEAYRDIGQITPGEARYLLSMLGENAIEPEPEPPPLNVREQVEAGNLVLLNYSPFSAYWRGNLILQCFRPSHAWNYLLTLAREARNCRYVECRDFGSNDPAYASKLKSRLVDRRKLPFEFSEKIVSAGHHRQRLDLHRDEIVIVSAPPDSTELA